MEVIAAILRQLRELVDGGMNEAAFTMRVYAGKVVVMFWCEGEQQHQARYELSFHSLDGARFAVLGHAIMKVAGLIKKAAPSKPKLRSVD